MLLLLVSIGLIDSGLYTTLFTDVSSNTQITLSFIALQFLIQALMVGLVTGFSYGFAIQRIGAETSAAIGALTPVLAAISAYFLLSENLFFTDIIAMLFIVFGVLLASEAKVQFFK